MRKLITIFACLAFFQPICSIAAGISKTAISSTVLIGIYDSDGNLIGRASGFIASPDGMVVTNKHVVENDAGHLVDSIFIIPTNANEEPDWPCAWQPTSVIRHSERDLALIITEGEANIPCNFNFLSPSKVIPETGTDIQILGYPAIGKGSLSITLTNGQIAGKIIEGGMTTELKTDAKIIPGVSGGPVFDDAGNLFGVATAYTMSSSENIGLITPLIYLDDLMSLAHLKPSISSAPATPPINSLPSTPNIIQQKMQKDIKPVAVERLIFSDVPEKGCDYLKGHEKFSESYQVGSQDLCVSTRAYTFLKSSGIMTGYSDGNFMPLNRINRAEFFKVIVEAFFETPDEDRYKNCFTDVQAQWFAKYVCFGKEKGWVSGYSDGSFKPDQSVSNMEAIKMLLVPNFDISKHHNSSYKHLEDSEWYADYLKTSLDINIVKNEEWSSKWFDRNGPINRRSIAVMLYKFFLVKEKNLDKYKFDLKVSL
ncbi:MAG: secreted protein [Candidatus Peribacteria bacterium]|nr:secreted protein [Candidatus Peribacteria bacterium]